MDSYDQNKKTLQLVRRYVQQYELKIKNIINADDPIILILSNIYKRLDAFGQDNHSYEEWVAAWRDIEQLKEAIMGKVSFTNISNFTDENGQVLSHEEYQKRIEALIHSDEHRALSLAQLSIHAFVNENYPSSSFLTKIARVLNNIQTKQYNKKEKETLWQTVLYAYHQKKDEHLKIIEMKQAIINHYFIIRKSPTGSEGVFFGKGSKFGDELEKFIKKEMETNVPHRVRAEDTPLQIK